MNTKKRILLLNGSPKANGGTSGSMTVYLQKLLQERGCIAEILRVKQAIASPEGIGKLLSKTAAADILVLAFPLYIDSLPYPVIKVLELIAAQRNASAPCKKQQFLAISNSGFPEAHQNETALAICRRFAKEADREWIGGLALGGGQAIDGRPLEKTGWLVRNIKKSLDLVADVLVEGHPLPPEAVRLMSKLVVPKWFYLWMGEAGGKHKAKRNEVWEKINNRPYSNQ